MTVQCDTSYQIEGEARVEMTFTFRADLLFERITEVTNNIIRRQTNRLEQVLRNSRLSEQHRSKE